VILQHPFCAAFDLCWTPFSAVKERVKYEIFFKNLKNLSFLEALGIRLNSLDFFPYLKADLVLKNTLELLLSLTIIRLSMRLRATSMGPCIDIPGS
jgi:hypothetical protein